MKLRENGEVGLGTLLRRLLVALDGDVQAIYDELGVPFRPRFFPVVRYLRDHQSASVGELAERSGVSQPAITQTLREMRAAGLIAVEPGGDRRARLVRLTVEGEVVTARLHPVWRAVQQAAGTLDDELPEPLGATLATALEKLAARPFRERILEAMEGA